MKNKKIGIMGGTFDPIHNGHLFIAEQVRIKYNLDKVLFIPSGQPPHKDGLNVSEAIHRYNMVNLAIASNDYFFSSLIEIDRKGNTYTIDTLKQLKTVYLDSEIYFIVGYDTIETIHTWKDYELLPEYTRFVVVSRTTQSAGNLINLTEVFIDKVDFFETPVIDISSTEIRQNIYNNKSITYMVDNQVERYIYKHNLYRARWYMEDIMIELKKNVSEKRYIHILGVIDSADELAEKFSVSKEKARLAAIFHDYAKGMSKKSMLEFAKANKLDFDDIEYGNKELMHGKIARHIAQNKYNVNDNDVLNAIEFHTTGRKKMSELEKLICLADYIEKNREYPGVDKIRNLVDIDYDLALYTAFNGTIIHLIEENKIVHTRTVEARNYLLSILNEKGVCVWNIF